MASGRLVDYMGKGTAASRPASLTLTTGALGLWYATDTLALSVWDGTSWHAVGGGGGSGTVTSVDLTAPSDLLAVTGNPVTTAGTLALAKVAQTTNKVYAAPNGSTGVPTFRTLVAADIPSLSGTYQPLDATLTALAGVSTSADQGIYATAADTFTTFGLTSFARTVLDDVDAATMRATIGAGTGSGTVTSVASTVPADLLTVAGSPVTTTGTLAYSKVSQTANFAYIAPNGSAGVPTFRLLAAADIPSLSGTYQPLDTTLTNLAAVNWASNAFPIGSGADTVAQITFAANTFPARSSTGNLVAKTITDFGLSQVDDADATAGRVTLGVVIGTDVQAYDSDLAAIAALTATTDNFIQSKASAWTSRTPAQVKVDLNLTGTNSGDQTITLTGDVTGTGTGSFAATIANNAVTNAKLADMATATFKGRTTAATGDPEDLTVTQATAMLNVFSSTLNGLAPLSGGGTSNYLRADGTWATPSGGTVPTGTGFTHITGGAQDAAAKLVDTADVNDGQIILAKMANMATSSLIYRKTAATGVPEVNTLATLKTDLGLTGTNSGDQTRASLGLATSDSPEFAAVNIGAATDTTITRVSAGVIAVEGSTVLVSGGALGTPSSGTLTNATGLPVAGITASTATALGVGSIELGHASDTTISRVSAGVVAVEGANVLLNGGALGTPSSATLTNATGLPAAGLVATTATAVGFGSINLGHASDTTITRSAAGAIQVEGVSVLMNGGALGTPSGGWLANAGGLPLTGIVGDAVTALPVGSIELGHATDTSLTRVSAGVAAIEGANILVSGGALGTPASGTLTNVTGLPTAGMLDNAVTNAKLADMATQTFRGRTTAGTGDPEDLTVTQATAMLNVFTSALNGLAPLSGGGTTNFLRADGTWAAAGGGSTPTGTGLRHVVGGVENAAASLVVTADITDANVTLAKMANMATASILGRNTAAAGVPEVLDAPTVRSILGTATTDSPQFTGINLGHASDTTLTRSAAGAIQVEGVQVLLSGAALGTPASGTLTNATGLPVAGITGSTTTALGVGKLELGHATDTELTRVSAGIIALNGTTMVTESLTQTLVNKRFTPRVYTAANNASLTPEIATYDIFHLTAMSAATTINNPSTSTPTDGEVMKLRFLDNGTARGLTWGTVYVGKGGITLPTTTVASKNLELGFEYNGTLAKWNLLASAAEA